ncbi:MAG: Lrp/AsnC family transcriptional regulator [Undibacterium sp.]|nr:Lrp/AsnC family transcriptional regulator [Undibacterium sp.]
MALSTTAIQRRIKRLRDERVIVAEQARIDPKVFGRSLALIVSVTLKIGRAATNAQFKKMMNEAPEVQQCYAVAGEQDFVLIISVKDMSEYEVLTHRLFHSNEAVQKFQTTVVMEAVKVGLQVPLD